MAVHAGRGEGDVGGGWGGVGRGEGEEGQRVQEVVMAGGRGDEPAEEVAGAKLVAGVVDFIPELGGFGIMT
jgi:hypothetical protein